MGKVEQKKKTGQKLNVISTKYRKYLFIILLIGFIVYLPVLFNGFVWDDIPFIINNSEVHQLTNLPVLIGRSMFNSGLFYRPLPAVYFAFLYSIFGQTAFFYHFIQLILHFASVYLLLIFFCLFFSESISFFLALLFLVHPVNVESVAFIGSSTSELFFIFGLTAFLFATDQSPTRKKLVIISILLLLSILAKETGLLFLLMILAYRYLFKLNKIKEFSLSGLCIVVTYLLMRVLVGGVTFSKTPGLFIPIQSLSFTERLLNIPSIIMYYLKTFLYPVKLDISQIWVIKTMSLEGFIIPLLLCIVLFILSLVTAYFLYKSDNKDALSQKTKKDKKLIIAEPEKNLAIFLFFAVWFILGMVPILQIFPLEMTVGDRWFYFSIVGLLGVIGIGVNFLLTSYSRYKKVYYLGALIILTLLALRTFVRTFDWKDNITLFSHDIKDQKDNYLINDSLAYEYLIRNKPDEAIQYAKKSIAEYPEIGNVSYLGKAYLMKNQYDKATATLLDAIKLYPPDEPNSPVKNEQLLSLPDTYLEASYINISIAYLLGNHPNDEINLMEEKALKKFPENSRLYLYLAVAQSQIHNHKEALKAITEAYKLSSDQVNSYYYNKIQNNEVIELPHQ